jgi:hypothetical protein
MPVITHQTKPAADVKREPQSDITQLESPNVQLYMTYKEESASCEVSEELMSWIDAKCEELEVCAPAFLLGCAELVREME